MRAHTFGTDQASAFLQQANKLKAAATEAGKWLTDKRSQTSHSRLTRTQSAVICAAIFVSALGVRLL